MFLSSQNDLPFAYVFFAFIKLIFSISCHVVLKVKFIVTLQVKECEYFKCIAKYFHFVLQKEL